MTDSFWVGSAEPGTLPDIEAAKAIPIPDPFTPEQMAWLRDKEIAAKSANLEAQGAFIEPDHFDDVFGRLPPRLTSNWAALLYIVEQAKKLYHAPDVSA